MQDNLLEDLTRELRDLRLETSLREATILSRIERIQQQQNQEAACTVGSNGNIPTDPVRINGIQRGD